MKKKQPAGVGMMPCKTELGSYVRERRLELGLRQVPLAEQAGLAQNQISQIELGEKKYLDNNQLIKLAMALKCDAEELRKRMPVKPGSQPTTELGKFIRSRREELGMTVENFAKKLKMTPQQARHLEIRKSPSIRYKLLNPLAKALNLDPSDLSKFVGTTRKESTSELGQLVRSRRKELGLSIGALADKMDVSRQFVNQIEFGQARLSANDEMVARLAKALDLDVEKLEAVRPERRLKPANNHNGLGGFLAAKRLELHLTQREVGERTETGANVISGIETGRLRPSANLLEKFSQILNCEIPIELIPAPHVREGSHVERETGLGKFLTEKRQELKLNQAQLAQKAGTSTAVVSGIERGTYRAGSYVLAKISKAIGCEIPAELIPPPRDRQNGHKKAVGFTIERTGLGKFVTTRRLELKLSQAQLGQRAGTGPAVISGIERGTYRPGAQMVERLTKALECEIPAELLPMPRQYGPRGPRTEQEGFSPSVMVHLSDQNLADLERIKELSDIRVNTEAVRKSLKILRLLLEKQKDGQAVCLRKGDTIVELEFLF